MPQSVAPWPMALKESLEETVNSASAPPAGKVLTAMVRLSHLVPFRHPNEYFSVQNG